MNSPLEKEDEGYRPSWNMRRLLKTVVLGLPKQKDGVTLDNLIDEWACEFAMGSYDEVIKRLDNELYEIVLDERDYRED
jgi:hypothetical protein